MIALLKALVVIPIALLLILLAIANRAPVVFSFDPFERGASEFAFSAPLYALLFGALLLGVLLGGVGAWLSAGRQRRSGRASRREVGRLKQETERLRTNLAEVRGAALPAPSRVA